LDYTLSSRGGKLSGKLVGEIAEDGEPPGRPDEFSNRMAEIMEGPAEREASGSCGRRLRRSTQQCKCFAFR